MDGEAVGSRGRRSGTGTTERGRIHAAAAPSLVGSVREQRWPCVISGYQPGGPGTFQGGCSGPRMPVWAPSACRPHQASAQGDRGTCPVSVPTAGTPSTHEASSQGDASAAHAEPHAQFQGSMCESGGPARPGPPGAPHRGLCGRRRLGGLAGWAVAAQASSRCRGALCWARFSGLCPRAPPSPHELPRLPGAEEMALCSRRQGSGSIRTPWEGVRGDAPHCPGPGRARPPSPSPRGRSGVRAACLLPEAR